MATITPYDLMKSEVLTRLIQKQLTNPDAIYDIQDLAPIVPTNERTVRIGVREADLSQVGQFRAMNQQTPLITKEYSTGGGRIREVALAILAEKDNILEDVYLNLRSPDGRVAQEAVRAILNSGVTLQKRNINLSRKMVWLAVFDSLVITLPDNTSFGVDFDFDNTDGGMSGSHMVPAPATLWSNVAADPIGDVQAWAERIATDAGNPLTELELWMSTKTFQYLQKVTLIQEEYGSLLEPRRPTNPQQIADLMGIRRIRLYDSTYKDAVGAVTRFLPENRVILFAPNTSGERNIQLLDGPVAMFDDRANDIRVGNNPGMRAEIWTSADPPTKNIRVQTARMPMIIREAIVVPGAVW